MFKKLANFSFKKKTILVLFYRVPRCNKYLAGLADESKKRSGGLVTGLLHQKMINF